MSITRNVFQPFFDLSGIPLTAGYIYFGAINQNPETSPITVYWDAGFTQPAAQPIRTIGGVAARNGTPAVIYTTQNYSISVRDQRGVLIYTMPNSEDFAPAFSSITFANGTQAAPSINFAQALQSGFYSYAPNAVAYSYNNGGSHYFSASGQVGIGIVPTAILDVNGASRFRAGVTIDSGGMLISSGGFSVLLGGANIIGNSTVTGNLTVTGGTFQSRGILDSSTAGTTQWTLDAANRWVNTTNTQVSFNVFRSGTQQNAGTTLLFNTVQHQHGGTNYAVGTGIFTAPVAGKYSFSASCELINSTGSPVQGQLQIVCSVAGLQNGQSFIFNNAITYASNIHVASVLLQAGETVIAQLNTALSGTFVMSTAASNRFSGYLLS